MIHHAFIDCIRIQKYRSIFNSNCIHLHHKYQQRSQRVNAIFVKSNKKLSQVDVFGNDSFHVHADERTDNSYYASSRYS